MLAYCSMYASVHWEKKKGKRGHNDECSGVIALMTVMMSTERACPDGKNTEKQPEPSIDAWLVTF